MSTVGELSGFTTLIADGADGPLDVRRLKDLMADAHQSGAAWLVVAADLLPATFFDLRSGVAGDILQATVTYQIPLAVVGPLPEPAASSNAFAALVRESNRGRDHWFTASMIELAERLATRPR
jgi:hypothetical protein